MAARLRHAGQDLTVYNRSAPPRARLAALGANAVDTPKALFAACDAIILMLRDDAAADFVLGRADASLGDRVAGKLIINMGTHAPGYSRALETEIHAGGGAFVEAPVSGSRGPAERGTLVAMLAGDAEAVERSRPLLAPMCREMRVIGPVPSATAMKLAVNLYLIATIASLAEAANLAVAMGVNLALFQEIIRSGPLRSDVAMAKLDKMVRRDFSPEAAIKDVCKNAALVSEAAAAAGADAVLLDRSRQLFEAVIDDGGGALDMAAVSTVFRNHAR
nr:NAD(P)-dependent oxidoreductase [Sphingomonas sp. So64.6b]